MFVCLKDFCRIYRKKKTDLEVTDLVTIDTVDMVISTDEDIKDTNKIILQGTVTRKEVLFMMRESKMNQAIRQGNVVFSDTLDTVKGMYCELNCDMRKAN